MAFDRFATRLALRVAVLFVLLAAVAWVIATTRFVAVPLVLIALAVAQGIGVVRFVGQTNRELARFLSAVRYDDYSQSFATGRLGATFAELEASFDAVMARFREARLERDAQRRFLEALVEHVPVAMLAVHADGTVELLNNAARRLLDATAQTTIAALERHGAAFQRDVAQSRAGQRTLTRTEIDGVHRHLIVSTTELSLTGRVLRLIALQDIQHELDHNELSAWQDMSRMLSHEILNSLTPISSLARTAEEMIADLADADPAAAAPTIADLGDAVHTLARRSEGLMKFVKSYRQLSQMPPPILRSLELKHYFDGIARLLVAEWAARGIVLHVNAPAAGLVVEVDENLLDQAVINILRNAAEAAAGNPVPQVWLNAGLSERSRPVIEVADNGPGIEAGMEEKIFLPFFTTKLDGSGIGLTLARQVMILHRGAISVSSSETGGARFRLTF